VPESALDDRVSVPVTTGSTGRHGGCSVPTWYDPREDSHDVYAQTSRESILGSSRR